MTRERARFILALLVILMGAGIAAALIFVQIPADNEAILNVALGAVLAWGGAAIHYYLGTSESSAQKTELLAHRPTGQPGDPVHVDEDDGMPRPNFGGSHDV